MSPAKPRATNVAPSAMARPTVLTGSSSTPVGVERVRMHCSVVGDAWPVVSP